jgi:hypothetical protein
MRPDDRALPDDRPVEKDGAHADQALVAHGAGVDNRRVPDRAPRADVGAVVIGEVDDRVVLDVGALADPAP